MESPVGPLEKLGRAKLHLHALDDEVNQILERGGSRISGHLDPSDGSYVFVLEWVVKLQYTLSLLVGDAAHNMRSALDHLAYMFYPSEWTEFPIFSKDTHPDLPKKLGWFPDNGAREYVELLQPYKQTLRGNRMRMLHDLDRFDKHRFLLMTPSRVTIPTPSEPILRRLDEGRIEIRITSPTEADIERYKTLKPKFALGIGLTPKPPGEVIPMQHLWEIHDLLDQNVIPDLSRFLS